MLGLGWLEGFACLGKGWEYLSVVVTSEYYVLPFFFFLMSIILMQILIIWEPELDLYWPSLSVHIEVVSCELRTRLKD